jgi:hypothetical protein
VHGEVNAGAEPYVSRGEPNRRYLDDHDSHPAQAKLAAATGLVLLTAACGSTNTSAGSGGSGGTSTAARKAADDQPRTS